VFQARWLIGRLLTATKGVPPMDSNIFRELVEDALLQGKWTHLKDWISDHSSFTFDGETLPEDGTFDQGVFEEIIALLNRDSFLHSNGSSNVLLFFRYDWAILTGEQKKQLLPAIVLAYPKLRDQLSWYVISELLGRFSADKGALDALHELKSVADDNQRSLIPTGLERLIKNSNDAAVREDAYNELKEMKNDPSDEVRQEVELSLRQVGN